MTRRRRLAIILAAAAATLGSAPACAQTAGVEELVVTAAKRETKLSETPMSLTVVNGAALKGADAVDFAGFAKLVPGLTYMDAGPGNKRYALRGLQSAGEPEVALYYDEIPIAGLPGSALDTGDSQPDLRLIDVDRIEVLRGPQGTLYGNGAMGGAIRILSKRPDLEAFSTSVEANTATTDGGGPSAGLQGVANLPLIQGKAGLRLVAYDQYDGGWIDQRPHPSIALRQLDRSDINFTRTKGGRLSLTATPAPTWTTTAVVYLQNMRVGDAFEVYPDFATADDRYLAKSFVRRTWVDNSLMANIISDYDLGFATFTATVSYQHRDAQRNIDTTRFVLSQFGCNVFTWAKTCSGPPLVPADSYAYDTVNSGSVEMRLASKTGGRLDWAVGGVFQDSRTRHDLQVATTNTGGYVTFAPNGTAIGRIFARENVDTFQQGAVFGEGDYHLTDRLTATAGLRLFDSRRSDTQTILQQYFPGAPTGQEPRQAEHETKLFKKVELAYRSAGNGLFYVEAAQGYRAGGPNYPGGFALSAPPYTSDSVWDYEAGWRADYARDTVHLEAAVFDIEWSNVQQLLPLALFSYIINGGDARSRGAEASGQVRLSDRFGLQGGVTYTDARLVGAQPASADPRSQLAAGDHLANVPRWTANGAADYSAPLRDGLQLTLRLDGVYQSARSNIVAPENPAYFAIKGYTLFDLQAFVERAGAWRIGLGVQNLFNRYAELSGRAEDSNLIRTITPARPRTVRLTLSVMR